MTPNDLVPQVGTWQSGAQNTLQFYKGTYGSDSGNGKFNNKTIIVTSILV